MAYNRAYLHTWYRTVRDLLHISAKEGPWLTVVPTLSIDRLLKDYYSTYTTVIIVGLRVTLILAY